LPSSIIAEVGRPEADGVCSTGAQTSAPPESGWLRRPRAAASSFFMVTIDEPLPTMVVQWWWL
jgi:hypothetical protein